MKIKIRGLEASACHGVNAEEKIKPQRFVFDADIYADFYDAAKSDDLTLTINYSKLCSLIVKVTVENSFNLIETLAYECAFAVMESFGLARKISLTVKKPEAPLKVRFESVEAEVALERTTSYLSLGSSVGVREDFLNAAIEKLNKTRGIKVEKVSPFMKTPPYGGVAQNEFLNCAVKISTLLPPQRLLSEIHRIENECGRVRRKRWDDRTLDIDIVFFGNRTVREENLVIPHPDYFNRPFVLQPLKSIAPDLFLFDKGVYLKDL